MTLDQLRYFVAAAKYEHINRAARSIPISASVISNAVKELEEEYRCELFLREKRRIRLTPQGIRFMEMATQLLSQAEGMRHILGQADAPLSGHFRIGASTFLASKLLAPAWTELQMKNPRLTADVCAQPTWTLVDNIISGRIDFGLGFSPTPQPQLETEELFRGNLELVVRKEHPIFSKGRNNLYKHLQDYPASMHIADARIVAARPHPLLKTLKLDSRITFSFDSEYVALENLRNSDNWSFMIDIAALELKKHLRIVSIPRKMEAQYTIHFIRHKTRRMDPAINQMLELIKVKIRTLWCSRG